MVTRKLCPNPSSPAHPSHRTHNPSHDSQQHASTMLYNLLVSSASNSCLSSYIILPPSNPSPSSSPSPSPSPSSCCKARRWQQQQRRQRGMYLGFVLLLALLGVTTSHSKIIEFICQRLGKDNTCDVHRCAPGEAPQHKPHSRPSFNGCGTHELKINLATNDMEQCCNQHDLCYGSCGRAKLECDKLFLDCMQTQCAIDHPDADTKPHRRCMREARLYWNGVVGFGCVFYKRAQRQHCECRPAGSPATYFDAHEAGLEQSLRAMSARAEALNKTRAEWEEFL